MIDPAARLSVSRQAIVLGISRGSVYCKPRPVSDADLKLMHRIDRLHMEFPFAGSRMLRGQLVKEGFKVGRLHFATLMKRMAMRRQGIQFTSTEFIRVLAAREIKISMPSGDCMQSPAGNRRQASPARQRLRRTPLAHHQIEGGLPAGPCQRLGSPRRDWPMSRRLFSRTSGVHRLRLQQPSPAFIA